MTSQSLVVNVNGQQRSLTHTELVTIGLSCLSVSIRSNAHGGKMMTDKEIWTLAGRYGEWLNGEVIEMTDENLVMFVRAIEAKLREKNHG